MLLGAFVDCGVSLAEVEAELKKLGISDEYYFTCEAVSKCGIAATHLDVEPTGQGHGHHHHHHGHHHHH